MRRILHYVFLELHAEVLDLCLQLLHHLPLALLQVHTASLEVSEEHFPHAMRLLPPVPHTLGCHGDLECRVQLLAPVQCLDVGGEVGEHAVSSIHKFAAPHKLCLTVST